MYIRVCIYIEIWLYVYIREDLFWKGLGFFFFMESWVGGLEVMLKRRGLDFIMFVLGF